MALGEGALMAGRANAGDPGYRRRILIEPRPGRVAAELEDDYHRMVVTLSHQSGIVTAVDSEMKRSPWTACPGAMQRLRETFLGVPLTDVARRGERTTNCTHLHDLALFAAAHADGAGPVAYEVHCQDPDGDAAAEQRAVRLWCEGMLVIDWLLDGNTFVAPAELAGLTLGQLGAHIATLDRAGAEAARIARWAAIVAHGRSMTIPTGIAATAFPLGNCYNFQPERATESFRRPGAAVDFSRDGLEPMADRHKAFAVVDRASPD